MAAMLPSERPDAAEGWLARAKRQRWLGESASVGADYFEKFRWNRLRTKMGG